MIKKPTLKNNRFALSAVLIFAFCFSACNKDKPQATPAPAPAAKPAQPATAKPKPVQKQVSSASRPLAAPVNPFDFSNKKDPFKPFVAVKVAQKPTKEAAMKAERDALPIHSFDVNQFKLIGVVVSGRENKAMVTDPNGKGYVLKVGMLIGKNDGRIVSINSTGIDVLEQFKDDNGKIRKEHIKLTLPRKQ
jgi:type IV pilus assembly protein PilP